MTKLTLKQQKIEKLLNSYRGDLVQGRSRHREKVEGVIFEIDKNGLISRLKAIKAKPILSGIQTIETFDYPDKYLAENNIILRIKALGPSMELQYKKLEFNKDYIGRHEKELFFKVDDIDAIKHEMFAIGLVATGIQQRELICYSTGESNFNLITWPETPSYIGIEANNDEKLKQAAGSIGLLNRKIEQIGGVEIFRKYNLNLKRTVFNKELYEKKTGHSY